MERGLIVMVIYIYRLYEKGLLVVVVVLVEREFYLGVVVLYRYIVYMVLGGNKG